MFLPIKWGFLRDLLVIDHGVSNGYTLQENVWLWKYLGGLGGEGKEVENNVMSYSRTSPISDIYLLVYNLKILSRQHSCFGRRQTQEFLKWDYIVK